MNKDSYVLVIAGVAALGGLLFGYDTGVMSGALLFVGSEFDMSAHQEGLVTSMLLVGAAVGALAAGRVADRMADVARLSSAALSSLRDRCGARWRVRRRNLPRPAQPWG